MAAGERRTQQWVAPRSDVDSALADVAPYRGWTREALLAEGFALSRAAYRLMAAALPAERLAEALAYEEPLRESEAAIWRQLVRTGRGGASS